MAPMGWFVHHHLYGTPFHLAAWKHCIENTFGSSIDVPGGNERRQTAVCQALWNERVGALSLNL
jgi:hypothetical protein